MTQPANPEQLRAMLQQAKALYQKGSLKEAGLLCRQVVDADPSYADALHLLGVLAFRAGRFSTAEDLLRIAISFDRSAFNYYFNLAQLLQTTGRLEEAIDFCQRGLAVNSDQSESYLIYGKILLSAIKLPEAIAAYRKAISLRPDSTQAHFQLGTALLLSGDFVNGWQSLELGTPQAPFAKPRWENQSLRGKRILLHSDQNLIDMIQFSRYGQLISQAGGEVILQSPPEAVKLMQTAPGVAQTISGDQPAPAFDFHCPLVGLPHRFKSTLTSLPATILYLNPDPEKVARWRQRIGLLGPMDQMKIGVVWSDRTDQKISGARPLMFKDLASALVKIPNARFFGLQKMSDSEANDPGSVKLINWTLELHDLMDAAALMENLDLVITVDGPIAHLAGALGKRVWNLVSHVPDWRWLLGRDTSPWYPTMTLFRQPRPDDWETPLQHIVAQFKELA